MADDQQPWHQILVDDAHKEQMGDLSQRTVSPMATIRTVLALTRPKDEEANHPLPALEELYDSLLSLPTSVDAKRAKLTAGALARDPYEHDPSRDEWDPEETDKPTTGRPGLPQRDAEN